MKLIKIAFLILSIIAIMCFITACGCSNKELEGDSTNNSSTSSLESSSSHQGGGQSDSFVDSSSQSCSHQMVDKPAKKPGCEDEGYEAFKECSLCGYSTGKTTINPIGHTLELVKGYPKTCEADGLTDGYRCLICKKMVIKQETIKATGHVEKDVAGRQTTCELEGLTDGIQCSVCKVFLVEQEVIPKLKHQPVNVLGYQATCTESGLTDGTKCQVCKTVLVEGEEIPALSHDYTNEFCHKCNTSVASSGLEFEIRNDQQGYALVSLGACNDEIIIIPSTYESKPVVQISENAFNGASFVESVVIPDSIIEISENAFSGAENLKKVLIESLEKWCAINFETSSANPLSIAHALYLNGEKVDKLTIPSSVYSISSYAFTGADFYSITLNKNLSRIGSDAFNGCYRLWEIYNLSQLNVTINSQLNGKVAFYALDVYSLESISSKILFSQDGYVYRQNYDDIRVLDYIGSDSELTISDNVSQINKYAFYGNEKVIKITIPASVEVVGEYAFFGAKNLKQVEISQLSSITVLKKGVFANCTSLESITIPSAVNLVEDDAFLGCDRILCYELNDVYYLGNDVDKYIVALKVKQNDNTYELCDGVKVLYDDLFKDNTLLESIVLPNSVYSIGKRAFANCTSLSQIQLSDSLFTIGGEAFINCSKLTTITLPESLSQFSGVNQFKDCVRLVEVFNLSSLNVIKGSIDNGYVGHYALSVSKTLNNSQLYTKEGATYYQDGNQIILIDCGNASEAEISADTTLIYKHALTNSSLSVIRFSGTTNDFTAIEKQSGWKGNSSFIVICNNGTLSSSQLS